MEKVLFLIHDLGGGGAEKVLVNLVSRMDRTRYDVTVIALFAGGINEQFLPSYVHYYTVFHKMIPGNRIWMKLMSPKQLHHLIIHDHYDIEISFLEGPAARIISGCSDVNTKIISWIHGEQHSEKKAASSFRSTKEAKQCYKRYDQIVCVSETVKEDFLNLFPDIRHISVCYNVIDSDKILSQKDEKVEEGIFSPNEVNLVAVGKIIPQKGFDRLARIVKRLRENGIPVHLYALGTGSEQGNINTYLQNNHLLDAFTFLGYKTNPYKYVAKCDLFVCASLSEGFSTATIEALIVGTPVCTVEVSGMKEMLGNNNEYGIITENNENALYDGIRYVLEEGHLKHYKAKAQERGRLFNAENAVKNVELLLTQLNVAGV